MVQTVTLAPPYLLILRSSSLPKAVTNVSKDEAPALRSVASWFETRHRRAKHGVASLAYDALLTMRGEVCRVAC
jgi:hypothetical protein